MPEKNVRLLEERSDGMCEAGCGRAASEIHHRRFLGRGGKHNLANLVAMCGGEGGMAGGNHSGCHGTAHRGYPPYGWAISAYERRAEKDVPFVDLGGRSWWLDDEGKKTTERKVKSNGK